MIVAFPAVFALLLYAMHGFRCDCRSRRPHPDNSGSSAGSRRPGMGTGRVRDGFRITVQKIDVDVFPGVQFTLEGIAVPIPPTVAIAGKTGPIEQAIARVAGTIVEEILTATSNSTRSPRSAAPPNS